MWCRKGCKLRPVSSVCPILFFVFSVQNVVLHYISLLSYVVKTLSCVRCCFFFVNACFNGVVVLNAVRWDALFVKGDIHTTTAVVDYKNLYIYIYCSSNPPPNPAILHPVPVHCPRPSSTFPLTDLFFFFLCNVVCDVFNKVNLKTQRGTMLKRVRTGTCTRVRMGMPRAPDTCV